MLLGRFFFLRSKAEKSKSVGRPHPCVKNTRPASEREIVIGKQPEDGWVSPCVEQGWEPAQREDRKQVFGSTTSLTGILVKASEYIYSHDWHIREGLEMLGQGYLAFGVSLPPGALVSLVCSVHSEAFGSWLGIDASQCPLALERCQGL